VSCVGLGGVLVLVWRFFSATVVFIRGGHKGGGRACLFAKVGNCLLKLLCALREEISGGGLSGEFLLSDTENG